MANASVTGSVTTDLGAPLAGFLVGAFEIDGCFGERLLRDSGATDNSPTAGFVRTGNDGSFRISYTPGTYTLEICVCTDNKRVITRSQVFAELSQDVFALPNALIVVPDLLDDWSVADGAFAAPIDGSRITFIVDNAECWDQVITAVDHATTSIHWMLFYLDISKSLMSFDPDPLTGAGRRLESALDSASERGVKVRLACNQLMAGYVPVALPYPFTTAAVVSDWFANDAGAPAGIEVRKLRTPAYTPIHTKFVVIDNREAFILGSPFVQDYYDSSQHTIDDARRGTFADVLCDSHAIKQPTHDVSLHLNGPVIGALNETFATHWNWAKPAGADDLAPDPSPPAVASNATVQVTRSLSGNNRFPTFPHGETTILDFVPAGHRPRQRLHLPREPVFHL